MSPPTTPTRAEIARNAPPIDPCDPAELRILKGLLSSRAACRWFEDMGVGLTVFTDRRCRVLATWAVQHDCVSRPALVLEALGQAIDEPSMGQWMEFTFGQASPPDPSHREALVATIAQRAEESKAAEEPWDVERADRRLDMARKGLELYDRIEAQAATPRTPQQLSDEATAAFEAMREACRELSGRWFPNALREAATYYERAGTKGADPAEGLAYLDMLLTFIRGEID